VYAYERVVQIFDGVTLLTTHPRATKKGQRFTRIEHYPPEKALYLTRPPQVCRQLAREVGPACEEIVIHLFSERPSDHRRAVMALLSLGERYGQERLEAACRRAVFFRTPRYVYVRSILNAGLENDPLPGETPPSSPQRTYQHERATHEFFPVGASPENSFRVGALLEETREVASC
jgi:hypothetical protein